MYFNPQWTEKELSHIFSDIGSVVAEDSNGKQWVGNIESAWIDNGEIIINVRWEDPDLKYQDLTIVAYHVKDKDELIMISDPDECPYHKVLGQGLFYTPSFRILEGEERDG